MATTTSALLADPEQVALLRELIHYARRVGAIHVTYAFGNAGKPTLPREHAWDLGAQRVTIDDGCLIYRQHGRRILSVREVTTARQAADLLAAIGVLPPAYTSTYRLGRQDGEWIHKVDTPPAHRRCRYCGATSGLRLLPGNPATGTPNQWTCWDDCRDSAR